jgi:anti-anti-sigma factor
VTAVHLRVDVSGTVVLAISGDVDRSGADRIHAAMQELLAVHRPSVIRIDVGHVTYLSQAGAATILAWRGAATMAGTAVAVLNATDHIVRQAAAYGYRDLFDP